MDRLNNSQPLALARALAVPLDGATEEIERTRRIPEPLLSQLHEAGLFRMLLPKELGGGEVEPGVYVRVLEELAGHDASVAWNLFVGNSATLIAPYLEKEAAAKIFSNPRTLVAWGPPHEGTAEAVEGGYRISGRWDFASGCRQANWMGVHCRVKEEDGSLRLNSGGQPTIRTLLFPADQVTLHDTWDTIGLRGTASDSYSVENIFVPEIFSGTRDDPTLRRRSGPLYAFPQQTLYTVGVAAVALGIGRAMLGAFVELAGDKTPRGQARLADTPGIQAGVAKGEAALSSSRAYLMVALAEIYDGAGETEPIDISERARIRLASTHAIFEAAEVTDWVYKAAGVSSIFPGMPFERRFRDMHTLTQQIQARESHFEAAGKVLLGDLPEFYF